MYNIVEFSNLCDVSPTRYDKITNIRYYDESLQNKAKDILMLTNIGFTTIEILNLIRRPITMEVLLKKKAVFEKQISDASNSLKTLERYIRSMSMSSTVAIREIPTLYYYCVRRIFTDPQDMLIEYMNMADALKQHNISFDPQTKKRAIYYEKELKLDFFDAECAIEIDRTRNINHPNIKCIEGYPTAAYIIHRGSLAHIDETYFFVMDWIKANGYKPIAEPRISYIPSSAAGCNVTASDFNIELFIPIEPHTEVQSK